jgi:hypothetical protein
VDDADGGIVSAPHPADADYTALNIPNEAALMAMADSALILHETLVRRGRRRESSPFPENTVVLAPPRHLADQPTLMMSIDPGRPEDHLSMSPIAYAAEVDRSRRSPNYSEAIFNEAVARAEAERGALSPVDSQMVRQFLSVLDEWMERLRSLTAASENAVMGHALNSIDLGRIGLKKVEGNDDAD